MVNDRPWSPPPWGVRAHVIGPAAGLLLAGAGVLEDLEAGAVAVASGDTISAVSGGLACIAGAIVLARLLPRFRRQPAQWVADTARSAQEIEPPIMIGTADGSPT